MPTYEYRCEHCHKSLESFQRMSDAPLVTCPYCGHDTLMRVVSGGAGVIYKGEGWYVTDYSKKSSGGKETGAVTSPKTVTTGTTSSQTKADAQPAEPSPAPKSAASSSAAESAS